MEEKHIEKKNPLSQILDALKKVLIIKINLFL